MEQLAFLIERELIVGLAILGGLVSFAGSWLLRRREGEPRRSARLVLHAGYAVTGLSVALFIVAGFASAYR